MNRLVTTAKRPEIEIACPAIPSVAFKSAAIGVNKLTGINSDAISIATQRVIDPTALQTCALTRDSGIVVFLDSVDMALP